MKLYKKNIFFSLLVFFTITMMPLKCYPNTYNAIRPFLVLENPSDSGMFAVFGSILGAINFYEKHINEYSGLKIDLNSGRYLDIEKGPNWWEYFFEPIILGTEIDNKYYFTLEEYWKLASRPDKYSSFSLIQKYIKIKPHIQEEVNEFVNQNFKGKYIIGVHHRGTDKITEWPLVAYEKTHKVLIETIIALKRADRKNLKVYVATDDQNFLNYLVERMPKTVIYSDFKRSSNATALHFNPTIYENNYQMGKEALLDCLLLSKSNILIRPKSSCLSSISTCFNPYMKVIELSGD